MISFFLLFLIFYVTTLDNFRVTLFVWVIVFILSIKKKYNKQFLNFIFPLFFLFLIPFINFWNYKYSNHYFIKDIIYFFKPILGLFIGYQLSWNNSKKILQWIVYIGVVIALIHLIKILLTSFSHEFEIYKIRQQSGFFNDFELYSLLICMFYKQLELSFFWKESRYYIIILIISILMYFSRTNFIQFILLYAGVLGFTKLNFRNISYFILISCLVIGTYFIIWSFPVKRHTLGIEGIIYKIKIIPHEIYKSKIDENNILDIYDHWRAYELNCILKQLKQEGIFTIFFGKGYGSVVDLKRKIYLGNQEFHYIPYIHNGYGTIYLKSGIVGLFMMLYFIITLIKFQSFSIKNNFNKKTILIRLISSTGIFLFFSTLVFLGLYNKADNKSILLSIFYTLYLKSNYLKCKDNIMI